MAGTNSPDSHVDSNGRLELAHPDKRDRNRLRQFIDRWLRRSAVVPMLLGLMALAIGTWGTGGLLAVFLVILGCVAVCCSVAGTWQHAEPERRPGEFSYQADDFWDLPYLVALTAEHIIRSTRAITQDAAAAWLGPQLSHDIHRVAWEALRCIDGQLRLALDIADGLGDDAGAADVLATAQRQVHTTQTAVEQVANHLGQCAFLLQEWQANLRRTRLRQRLETTSHDESDQLVVEASWLPKAVFACVTSARDVFGAGPFPWELPVARTVK